MWTSEIWGGEYPILKRVSGKDGLPGIEENTKKRKVYPEPKAGQEKKREGLGPLIES